MIFPRKRSGLFSPHIAWCALFLLLAVSTTARAVQPTFVYQTSVPGYYLAEGAGIVLDDAGNAYVVGRYYGDQIHADIFVFKVSPDGHVLWTRSLAGSQHDWSQDIALSPAGDVWITGFSDSDDYPITQDAMDGTLTGFRDVILTELSPDDGSILYSTFLGGDYTDVGGGIAFDHDGNIILAGTTGSTDFPTTPDAWQQGPSAPLYIYTDAFVTRLDPTGHSILYSTYFGGYRDDDAENVAVDAAGDIIFSGTTTADDFPLQSPIQSDPHRIFVSKLSPSGHDLLFSTYFGGSDLDDLWDMKGDADGNVYLAGDTRSIDFPVTPGAFQTNFVGGIYQCGSPPFDPLHNCEDGWVAKMATDGSGLVFDTFLAGSWIDRIRAVAPDLQGNIHVTGETSSDDFPGTVEPGLILVSALDPTGSDLLYTLRRDSPYPTYAITTDPGGDVYITGAIDIPAKFYVARLSGGVPAGIGNGGGSADVLSLGTASPNPTSGPARISYAVPAGAGGDVSLAVYDAAGRLVRTLVDGPRSPGVHTALWDGLDGRGQKAPTGIYYYALRVGAEKRIGHLVRIR